MPWQHMTSPSVSRALVNTVLYGDTHLHIGMDEYFETMLSNRMGPYQAIQNSGWGRQVHVHSRLYDLALWLFTHMPQYI